MTDYTGKQTPKDEPNTTVEPEDEIEVKQLVEAKATKPGLGVRFKNLFIGGDFQDVKNHVVYNVVIPGLKDTVWKAFINGGQRFLYGLGSPPGQNTPGNNTHVTYNTAPMRGPVVTTAMPRQAPRVGGTHLINTITMASFEDAHLILETMYNLLNKYNVVSVAEFYEMCGQPINAIDHKWGWRALPGSGVRQVSTGFIIDLPAVEPI